MAKKIVKGVGGLLGIGKKKKKTAATAETPAEGKPIITQLNMLPADHPLRKRITRQPSDLATILGGGGTLG